MFVEPLWKCYARRWHLAGMSVLIEGVTVSAHNPSAMVSPTTQLATMPFALYIQAKHCYHSAFHLGGGAS
jgi:hypothetical protein